MTAANTTVLELLGKQVSFTLVNRWASLPKKGTVKSVVVSVEDEPEFLLDDGHFYAMSEIQDFKVTE